MKYILLIIPVVILSTTSCHSDCKFSLNDGLLVAKSYQQKLMEIEKEYDICDTLSLNVLNKPFELDSSFKFVFYLNDFLIYEGKYKDDILIHTPCFEKDEVVSPYFKIIDQKHPEIFYTGGVKEVILWREGIQEIILVFLPGSKKVEGGAVFFTTF
jgi:hypothetical protein